MASIFDRIRAKAQQAFTGIGNSIDRDQSMGGVQLAKGGLGNRIGQAVGNVARSVSNTPLVNQPFSNQINYPIKSPTVSDAGRFVRDNFIRPAPRAIQTLSSSVGQAIGASDGVTSPEQIASAMPYKPARDFFYGENPEPILSLQNQTTNNAPRNASWLQDRGVSPGLAQGVSTPLTFLGIGGLAALDAVPADPTDFLKAGGKATLKEALPLVDDVAREGLPLLDDAARISQRADEGFTSIKDILANRLNKFDNVADTRPINKTLSYLKPKGANVADFMVDQKGVTNPVKEMTKKATDEFFLNNKPVTEAVSDGTQKMLSAPNVPLALPQPKRGVTVAQLKKLIKQGDSLEGVTVAAKNADEAREAIKLGVPGKAIRVSQKAQEAGDTMFAAGDDILKELPENQDAFDFAREASKETLDTGNRVTRFLRNVFLDTETNLRKTFGDSYKAIEPVMEKFKTRIDDGLKWSKGYENKLVELTRTVKAGSQDDKLLREFGKKDGAQKVIEAVGVERAGELENTYTQIRGMYEEIIDFVNTRRKDAGLAPVPYKKDFLSQIGSSKSMFGSFLEGSPRVLDNTSSAIFKKQDGKATTGAIESMTSYLEYAQKAGFTDLTGREITQFADQLAAQKGANMEAVGQLRKVSENILGNKEVNPVLKGIENVVGKMAGAKVVGKFGTLVSQTFSLPQAIGRDPIAFVAGNVKAGAYKDLRSQSRVLDVVSKATPRQLRTGNAFTKAVGYAGEVLVKAQDTTNRLIFNSFLDRAKSLGMDDAKAVKWADEQLVEIVGDRRLGMSPQVYSTFIGKIFANFTIEPTASVVKLAKDIGEKKFGSVLGTLVAFHIGNNINEKYGTGFKPFLDPYDAIKDSVEYWNGSDEKEQSNLKAVTRLISESLKTMPMINNMVNTAYSAGETAGILPDSREVFGQDDNTWMNTGSLLNPANNFDRNITGNKLVDVPWNIAANTLPFFEQGAKFTQAALSKQRGYAETKSGSPMYQAPEGALETGRSLLFGQSSTKNAQDFFDNDFTGWLSDKQKAAFDLLPTKEQKLDFLQSVQPANEDANKIKSKTKSVQSMLDAGKAGSGTGEASGIDTSTAAGREAQKDYVTTLLDAKQIPAKADISQALFSGKSATSKSIEERMDTYKALKTAMDAEFRTPEQKQAILGASGASPELYEYYNMASKDKDVRLQEILPKLDNMDTPAIVESLMKGRRMVAGKQLVSNDMVDYLYENDYISKDEQKAIKALKWDEINDKPYFTKSYTKSESGSLSYSQAKKLSNVELPKFSRLKSLDYLSKSLPQGGSQRAGGDDRLIDTLLNAPNKRRSGSGNLWF